jgi:hypothetical protein
VKITVDDPVQAKFLIGGSRRRGDLGRRRSGLVGGARKIAIRARLARVTLPALRLNVDRLREAVRSTGNLSVGGTIV